MFPKSLNLSHLQTWLFRFIPFLHLFPPLAPFSENCTEVCLFNAVCVVEQLKARCACDPIDCDGAYKPVCGRNGHTYPNDCARRKAECMSKTLIPIKHQGPCGEWSWRMASEVLAHLGLDVNASKSGPSCRSLLIQHVFSFFANCTVQYVWKCLKGLDDAWWGGDFGKLKATGRVLLLYENRAFTPPLVHLPSIFSSRSRFIPPSKTHASKMKCHLHVSFIRSVFYSFASLPLRRLLSSFSLLCLGVFVCVCYFLYKKSYSFLFQCLSLSVCLCPCGCLPGCLAAGGKWGHPVGDLIRWILKGEAHPLAPCGPNRRGLVLLPFSCVPLCR